MLWNPRTMESDAGAGDLRGDVLDLLLGQLREHRQRHNLAGRLQRLRKIRPSVTEMAVSPKERQRDGIVHARADALGLQELLKLLAAAVPHANHVKAIPGPPAL